MGPKLLHLAPSAAAKEKRLAALLEAGSGNEARAQAAVEEAWVQGSLELAGVTPTPEETARAHRSLGAVPAGAPLTVEALLAWHAAAVPGGGTLRTRERAREGGPPPAPAAFVASRLAILEQWLNVESSRELKPAQAGALVMARLMEILPFDEGTGRVARLAATHLMRRGGSRPPILVGADAPRLATSLQAAYRLDTEPLTALLDECAERALDVMIRASTIPP